MVEIRTLSGVSYPEILDCFNTSFSDYSIPFQLNMEQFEKKIRSEGVNKAISIGSFRDKKLIGFVLHGDRTANGERMAYNAGTGVIPDERGHKLTKRMYNFIVPQLRNQKIKEVVLEVISSNVPAIKSYNEIGFKRTRMLTCFSGELMIREYNRDVEILEQKDVNINDLSQICEVLPTWQNSNETILKLDTDALYLLAYKDKQFCGYMMVNKNDNRILQIAVKKKMRNKKIGSTLLKYFSDTISRKASIINVDSRFKSASVFFEKNNLKQSLVQFEMKFKIAGE